MKVHNMTFNVLSYKEQNTKKLKKKVSDKNSKFYKSVAMSETDIETFRTSNSTDDIMDSVNNMLKALRSEASKENTINLCAAHNIFDILKREFAMNNDQVLNKCYSLARTLLSVTDKLLDAAIKSGLCEKCASRIEAIIEMPRDKQEDPHFVNAVSDCCGCIWGLCQSEEQHGLIKKDIIIAIQHALEQKIAKTSVTAMGALLSIAEDDDCVELISKTEVMKTLKDTIKMCADDVNDDTKKVCRYIGGFLCNAGCNQTIEKQFVDYRLLEQIMRLLEKVKEDSVLVGRLMLGLASLTSEIAESQDYVIQNAKKIGDIAETHMNDADVIEPFTKLVFNLSLTDDMTTALNFQCTDIIVRHLSQNETIATNLAGYLMNITAEDHTAEEISKRQDIIKGLCKGMNEYTSDKYFTRCCRFLQNICKYDHGAATVSELGVMGSIIKVLNDTDDEEVQEACLGGLTNCSLNDQLAIEIGQNNFTTVGSKLLASKTNEEIIKLVLRTGTNMSCQDVGSYIDADFVKQLMELLNHSNLDIVKRDVVLLYSISKFASCQNIEIEQQYCQKIPNVMAKLQDDDATIYKVFQTVFELSCNSEAQIQIVKSGVIDQMLPILGDNPVYCELFCGIIGNCSITAETHEDLATYLPDVLRIIEHPKSDKYMKAISYGLNALTNISSSDETRKNLVKLNIPEKLSKLLQNYREQQKIVVTTIQALTNLAMEDEIKKQLHPAGCLHAIVPVVKGYIKEMDVIKRICNFLAATCNRAPIEVKKAVYDTLNDIIEQLIDCIDDASLKEKFERIQKVIAKAHEQ